MITPEQRAARRGHIGSSDVAAVLGLDPFRSGYDVWLEKVHGTDESATTKAADAGNRLESAVLDWAESQLGPLDRDVFVPSESALACNVDAVLRAGGEPVEAKTTGIVGPVVGDWGEGGDEVPDRVIMQAHAHMLALGAARCHIPALIGGRGFVMFRVGFNPALGDAVHDAVESFWRAHVVSRVPPDDCKPSMDVLRRIRREPNKLAVVPPDLVAEWEAAAAAAKVADKAADTLKAMVIAALGDAEGAELADGRMLTYYAWARDGYTVQPSSYRVLKITKPKRRTND